MRILCLCPTYGRPRLAANALACFTAQDYPAHLCKLLIFDDLGALPPAYGPNWRVMSINRRARSLPEKYNTMLLAEGWLYNWDAVAVWDDDDIYLPWHLTAAAAALAGRAASCKPSTILSLYRPAGATGAGPWPEPGAGRFHCSCVFSAARLRQLTGWIQTRRADFDQQMIHATAPAADTLPYSPGGPSFVYRWGSTGTQHCSALMRAPDNEDWYDRYEPPSRDAPVTFGPVFDAETLRVMGGLHVTR
jgi:hypothetical protein